MSNPLKCNRLKSRRTFQMQVAHTPMQTSSFAGLPRDVTHLVLLHLSFPFLCMIKATSSEVANACRRTLLSRECLRKENYGNLGEMLYRCDLTFPIRTTFDFSDTDDLPVDESALKGSDLIVHEFNVEFLRNGRRVTDRQKIIDWWFEAWQNLVSLPFEDSHTGFRYDGNQYTGFDGKAQHLESLQVEVTRFCVEHVGVGMYHSVDGLWQDLGLEKHFQQRLRENSKNSPYHISNDYAYRVVELAVRLRPYARFGGKLFQFGNSVHKRVDWDGICVDTCTLWHGFIDGRIV